MYSPSATYASRRTWVLWRRTGSRLTPTARILLQHDVVVVVVAAADTCTCPCRSILPPLFSELHFPTPTSAPRPPKYVVTHMCYFKKEGSTRQPPSWPMAQFWDWGKKNDKLEKKTLRKCKPPPGRRLEFLSLDHSIRSMQFPISGS